MKVKADMNKKQVKALMKDMGAEIIEAEQNGILMDVIGSIAKVFGVDMDVVTNGKLNAEISESVLIYPK